MDKLLSSPQLVRLARHRKLVAAIVVILFGVLAAWAIVQTRSTPLAAIAWVFVLILLGALVYVSLDAARRLQDQAAARADMAGQLATLAESNAALKATRQELAQQKLLAENLLAVARATGQQPILENTLQNVLDITAALTDTTHGTLFLFDPQGRVAQQLFTRHDTPLKPSELLIGRILQDGLAGWAIRNRQLACSKDTRSDPRWLQRPDQPYAVCSAIAVPFISRGAVIGVLTLTHAQANHFTKTHEELLGNATDQIAIALDNAKMFDTMMHMADRMGLLYTLSELATGANLEDTLVQSVRAIRQATHWPGLTVMLPDGSRSTLITHASAGSGLPERLDVGDALIVDAWCTCKTMVVVSQDVPILAAPMCADERPLGVLLVRGDPANTFVAEDVEMISSAADALTTAVVNAELRRKVEELSQRAQVAAPGSSL